MVMEAVPSPQCVGREFVRQYYTLLNKAPLHLHRFYNHDSSFVHGGLKERLPEEVHGQQQIHQKIMELDFHDCKAKILLVDSHRTLDNGVVVQVSGELSNNGQPMRRFVQTFVLAPQSAKKYYVRNDIFRYQDDAYSDDEDCVEERPLENENEVPQSRPVSDSSEVESNNPVAPAVAAVPITPSTEVVAGNSVTVNGSNHHGEEEVRSKPAAPLTGYTAASTQQPEPIQAAPQPVKPPKTATPPAAAPAPIEKFEAVSEPVREPEPPVVAPAPEPAPPKRAPEPVAASKPSAPSEPKTFANLFKNPGAYNGTTTGLPSTVPPFGSTKPAPTPTSTSTTNQTTSESTSVPSNVNGNENFPAARSSENQRNNYRPQRTAPMGNGRTSSGPGSYNNKDRDQERGEKNERWSDNRAPSRDSTEEIGEWKQPNGGEGYQRDKDREFRRYDDNQQVFVGNIPHSTTEDNLKELFEQFGTVIDVRINGKTNVRPGERRAPLYAFVVFDSPKSADAALADKPMLNGDHRLNVEPKRRGFPPNSSGPRDQRGGSMNRGGGGGGMGGPGRGGRPMGSMGMSSGGPPREGGGGRGMGSGGRGGYMPRRQ